MKIEEKCGRERPDDMTASRANGIRAKKIDGEPSRMEKREAIRKAKEIEASKMTSDALWKKWQLFIAYTGIRRGSVQNLKRKDIDLDNATADRPHGTH